MRTLALALVVATAPAAAGAAVPSNRAIALELGVATPPGAAGPAARLLALSASGWLEGPLEAVATVAWADGGGRGPAVRGTVGLRVVTGRRWLASLGADAGWAAGGRGGASVTWGAGAGLGWRCGEVVLGLRSALRAGPGGPRLEIAAALEARY